MPEHVKTERSTSNTWMVRYGEASALQAGKHLPTDLYSLCHGPLRVAVPHAAAPSAPAALRQAVTPAYHHAGSVCCCCCCLLLPAGVCQLNVEGHRLRDIIAADVKHMTHIAWLRALLLRVIIKGAQPPLASHTQLSRVTPTALGGKLGIMGSHITEESLMVTDIASGGSMSAQART